MATARERLLQAMMAIVAQPFSEDGFFAMMRLLNAYRVQAKPGENLANDKTARDALADSISGFWQQRGTLDKKDMSKLVSTFRMQLKQGTRGRISYVGMAHNDTGDCSEPNKILTRAELRKNASRYENAYFRKGPPPKAAQIADSTAVAGGPQEKTSNRGQCPKCRSLGIVLARAYGGDDYHSCIYCGYQAYLKSADPRLDLPLAAELLGKAIKDTKLDDED